MPRTGAGSSVECGFVYISSDGEERACREMGPHFCWPRALKPEAFFREVLVHTKGRWARRPFELRPWQRDDIIYPLFGEVVFDEQWDCYVRLFQLAWIELGRGNGKSEIDAGIALYLEMGDDEESAEIYGAAKDVKQARKVWDVADRMTRLSPVLGPMRKSGEIKVNVQEKRLVYEPTASYYEVVTSDAAGELGGNPHGIVFDEVLTQDTDALWEVLESAMGKREQPLMVGSTTAGENPVGFAASEHKISERTAQDQSVSPRRFVFMRNLDEDADPWDERNWYFPNPALGDFLSIETLRKEAADARLLPRKEQVFRLRRLNQWGHTLAGWLPLGLWDESGQRLFMETELDGRTCYAGLSAGSTTDLTAWCLLFPEDEGYKVLWRFWIPEANLEQLDQRTDGEASAWVRDSWIDLTPGDMTDFDEIERHIDRDARTYTIVECGFPPWQAHQLIGHLQDGGMTVVPVRQTIQVLTDPSKELERLVARKLLWHNNNPVARWMAGNTVLKQTPDNEFMKPDKERSSDTIVGISATINGLERAIRAEDEGVVNLW